MIAEEVYNLLKERTETSNKTLADLNAVDAEIKSGRYSSDVVNGELYPKRHELHRQLKQAIDAAGRDARQLVADYQDKLREEDSLNPAELNDDVKLLNAGVKLLPRDIKSMLNRNAGNRTMTQLILRYAKANDIETGVYYAGNKDAIRDADGVLTAVDVYCRNWMHTDRASAMLDRFFNQQ